MQTYFTAREAAEYIRVSEKTLEKLRATGNGPRFSKLGRKVLYKTSDLEIFMDERTYKSTSQYLH